MNGSRKFGVEIEFLGNEQRVIECLEREGIYAQFQGYPTRR